jgi:hypothetical protein
MNLHDSLYDARESCLTNIHDFERYAGRLVKNSDHIERYERFQKKDNPRGSQPAIIT